MRKKEKNTPKRNITSKQVVALFGVVLLVLLYVITLVAAIADTSASAQWFRISLFGTFAIPLVIWIYAWMYSRLTGKHTIGDPKTPSDPNSELAAPETERADCESDSAAK